MQVRRYRKRTTSITARLLRRGQGGRYVAASAKRAGEAEVGEQKVSTYTNDEGTFKIPGLGKETVADSVVITCAKQGYRTLDMSRRRLSGAADAPVVVECLLEPTP